MLYMCDGKQINIPDNKKPFGKGSEGQVYKIDNKLYKIYYPTALFDSYGTKEHHHQYLSLLNTSQIVMPLHAIYDYDGKYVGYSSDIAFGSQKDKTGIILMSSDDFLINLRHLEEDFNLMSDNYVVGADISPVNYIFDKDNNVMRIIDPGRYKHHIFDSKDKYYIQNRCQFEALIDLLIKLDIIKYKPIDTKKKQLLIANLIEEKRKKFKGSMLEFYEHELDGYKDVYDYSKSLSKYIK